MVESKRVAMRVNTVLTPSMQALSELENTIALSIELSKCLATDIEYNPQVKQRLKNIHQFDYLRIARSLEKFQKAWPYKQRKKYVQVRKKIEDSLFVMEKKIVAIFDNAVSNSDFSAGQQEEHLFNHYLFEQMHKSILADIRAVYQEMFAETNNSYLSIRANADVFDIKLVFWGIFLIITLLFVVISLYNSFVKPIRYVKNELFDMAQGALNTKDTCQRKDEIGQMIKALGDLTSNLLKAKDFAKQISKGNYRAKFEPLGKNDELGTSLIDLRDNLEQAINEASNRRDKEQIQNWITQGMAKFADILRQNSSNSFELLGRQILRDLVEYMGINQAGMFVYYDQDKQDPYLELIAVYAYNRDKFLQKRIVPGEGIVGACFSEKRTIYMTEIPGSYLSITSGLGKANPKSILVIPLKIEDNVLGVIELASFSKFESHQISFVEKIGESIASTIQTVRTSHETKRLLDSITQQSEAMKSQEEEMRQNMEELLATQEEAQRREQELIDALQHAKNEIKVLNDKVSSLVSSSST